MMTTSDQTRRELNTLRLQWKPILISALLVVGIYFIAVNVSAGWLSYIASSIALLIVMVTSLVRANLIGHELTHKRWHVRRFGLVLVGLASVWLLLAPFGMVMDFPTWKEVLLRWGFALSWLTTPGMPPWWRLMTGRLDGPWWHHFVDEKGDWRDNP
jgi:hypothetical protein